MALGGIIGAALTTPAAHPWSLTLDGLDVIKKPGAAGNGYGTPIEGVEVTEAAPGRVSGMVWTIDDPAAELTITAGAFVVLWDHTNDVPAFAGFLMTPTFRPSGVGRLIDCRAIGIEAILDWAILPAFTPPAVTFLETAIQAAVAQAAMPASVPGLNVATAASSSQATPIGSNGLGVTPSGAISGGTLRAVIQAMIDRRTPAILPPDGVAVLFTIDFYGGLRVYRRRNGTPTDVPSDYATLTVTDTAAGAIAASNLEHTVDMAGTIRGVAVVGGNAAGTGVVMDGTGEPGPIELLTDAAILTDDDKRNRAWAVMAPSTSSARGSFDLVDTTIAAGVHAGSPLVLTDAQTGATGTYNLGELVRTYTGSGRQNVKVTYGNPAPSFVDRATLR